MMRRPPSVPSGLISSASRQIREARDRLGIVEVGVQVLDADVLEAVAQVEPAEDALHRHAEHDVAARRLLRELERIHDVPVEDVDAAGDRPVEQERLGEGHLIVLVARARQHRRRQRFAAAHEVRRAERELQERAFVLRIARAELQLVAVLLFQLQRDVDLVLLLRRLLDLDRLVPLELLEVAELIQTLDAVLQRLGVEDAVLDEVHLAPDHVIARGVVPHERDPVDEELLALLHVHRHVDDGGLLRARRPAPRRTPSDRARPAA